MTAMATEPQGRAKVKPAGGKTPPAPQPPAQPRGRRVPLTPMRVQAAKSMSRLADQVAKVHPETTAHLHVRDAARMLRAGNEEAAQRHLRAAVFSLTPQSLHRQGVHDDDGHIAAREAMHGVHRHLLLVKDIVDVAERNQQAIARDSYGDDTSSPPPPAYGGDPGALAQKPVARQPGGDRALNAPDRTNSGGSDPAVADPVGRQPKGSKQFGYTWDDLATVIELVGPHGYIHGWIFVGIPGTGAKVTMPFGRHATGHVESSDKTHAHVRLDDGSLVHVPHSGRPGPGKIVPADQFKAPPDSITGKDGTMAAGDWQQGHQAIAQAPLSALPTDRSRYINGKNVKGAWSDPWWMAKPGGGFAVSARWKSKEQQVFSNEPGKPFSMVTAPARDERVLTPFGGDTSGRQARAAEAEKARQAVEQEKAKAQAAEAEVRKQQQAAAAAQKRIDDNNRAVQAQRDRNAAEAARKAAGADAARAKGIEPGAKVLIDSGPYKGGIGTVRSVDPGGKAQVDHMGRTAFLGPDALRTQPANAKEAQRLQAVRESAEAAKRDAEQRQHEAEAAQANSRGMDRMFALHGAQRAHFAESTGLTIPQEGQFGLGVGSSDFRQAENHLLAGRHAEGIAALDRAVATERSLPGKMSKTQTARLAKLQKFRDQVAQATAHPKATLPALAKVRGGPKGMTALDHNGVEHKISLKDGAVSVTRDGKTASGPAGDNPTMTARRLAGQLADGGGAGKYSVSQRGGQTTVTTPAGHMLTDSTTEAQMQPEQTGRKLNARIERALASAPGRSPENARALADAQAAMRSGRYTQRQQDLLDQENDRVAMDLNTMQHGTGAPFVSSQFMSRNKPKLGSAQQHAVSWGDLASVVELSARTPMLESTPAPYGKPSGPGLYGVKGQKHSDYFEQVVQALMRKRGMSKGQASAVAWGALRKWRAKSKHAEVRAAASGALAEEASKVHGHASTWDDIGAEISLAASGATVAGWDGAAVELATIIDLFNPAQPRVPPGQTASGQFAPPGGAQQQQQQQQKQQQGKNKQAKGKKGKGKKKPGKTKPPSAAEQKAARKKALLAAAEGYRTRAHGILNQIQALQKIVANAQKATGKTVKASSNVTKGNAPAKTTAAATKAGTPAASAAASAKTATSAAKASAKPPTASQARQQLPQLRQQYTALMKQAATATAQAAKL